MGKLKKLWDIIKWAWGILKQAWLYTVLLSTTLAIIYGGLTLIYPSMITEPMSMPLAILQMSAIAFAVMFISAMIALIIVRLIEERFPSVKSTVDKKGSKTESLPPAIRVLINSKDFAKTNLSQTKQFFNGVSQGFTDYVRALKEWERFTKGREANATKEEIAKTKKEGEKSRKT